MTQSLATSSTVELNEPIQYEVRWWQPTHPNAVPWLLGKLLGNPVPSTVNAAEHSTHSTESDSFSDMCVQVFAKTIGRWSHRQQKGNTGLALTVELPTEKQLTRCRGRIIRAPHPLSRGGGEQSIFGYSSFAYYVPRADVDVPYFLLLHLELESRVSNGGKKATSKQPQGKIFCLISRHQEQVVAWSLHRWATLAAWETVRCRWLLDKIAYAQTMSGGWACVRNVSEALRWAGILMKLGQLLGDRSTVRKCRVFVGYGYLWNGERERARTIFQAEQIQGEKEGDDHQIRRCIAALHHLNGNPEYSPERLAKVRGSDTVEEIWSSVFASSNAKQNVIAVSVPGVAPDHLLQ